jgi:hypothetical protein
LLTVILSKFCGENKIEKILWTKRNLTILGKSLIIKSLIVPIFTYVASACVVPEKYRKEIDSKYFKFIIYLHGITFQ